MDDRTPSPMEIHGGENHYFVLLSTFAQKRELERSLGIPNMRLREDRNMDVFEFLLTNEAHLAHRLNKTAAHYADWTQDRVFEETKRVLEGLKCNFTKENALISTIHDVEEMQDIIKEAEQHRNEIRSDAENLCMIHVDEPGFEQGLQTLAGKFERHREFCQQILFPKLKEHAEPEELESVADQLDAVVLDG